MIRNRSNNAPHCHAVNGVDNGGGGRILGNREKNEGCKNKMMFRNKNVIFKRYVITSSNGQFLFFDQEQEQEQEQGPV